MKLNEFIGKTPKEIILSKNDNDPFIVDFIKISFENFDKVLIIEGTVNGNYNTPEEGCYVDEYYTVIYIEDIVGDFKDIIGNPLLKIEERKKEESWVFYELATIKGSVTIRFNDETNDWYSSCADVEIYNTVNEVPDCYKNGIVFN